MNRWAIVGRPDGSEFPPFPWDLKRRVFKEQGVWADGPDRAANGDWSRARAYPVTLLFACIYHLHDDFKQSFRANSPARAAPSCPQLHRRRPDDRCGRIIRYAAGGSTEGRTRAYHPIPR